MGLLFNKFYLTCGMSKKEIIATRATNQPLLHIIKLVLYSLFGLMTYQTRKPPPIRRGLHLANWSYS